MSAVVNTLTALPTPTISSSATPLPTATTLPTATLPIRLDLVGNSFDQVLKKLEMQEFIFLDVDVKDGNGSAFGYYKYASSATVVITQHQYTLVEASLVIGFDSIDSEEEFNNLPRTEILYRAIFNEKIYQSQIIPWKDSILDQQKSDYFLCFDGFMIWEHHSEPQESSNYREVTILLEQNWSIESEKRYGSCN